MRDGLLKEWRLPCCRCGLVLLKPLEARIDKEGNIVVKYRCHICTFKTERTFHEEVSVEVWDPRGRPRVPQTARPRKEEGTKDV